MKRIIRLTESDLTRIVRRVINEGGYGSLIDSSQFEFNEYSYKPFNDLLTKKYNFEYLKNNNGMHTYILKKDDCAIIVGTQSSYEIGKVLLFIYIVPKEGEKINYIEEVTGKPGLKVSDNETTKVSRFVKGSIEYGK